MRVKLKTIEQLKEDIETLGGEYYDEQELFDRSTLTVNMNGALGLSNPTWNITIDTQKLFGDYIEAVPKNFDYYQNFDYNGIGKYYDHRFHSFWFSNDIIDEKDFMV